MSKAMRQMLGQPGRASVASGEAASDLASDEACGPPLEHPRTGSAKQLAGTGGLLEVALTRQNLQAAWKRVKANRGAAGVDGLNIEQTAHVLRTSWPEICQALLAGSYRPSPVRKVLIPKPDGSQRELGIPTVMDRLIQQALLQMLQSLIDPTFSELSHGFRPGRRAHDAVKAARAYVQSGKRAVASAFGRKFLGYELWMAKGKEVKCAVAYKALDNFKAPIRQLTRRSGGRSMAQVVEKLRPYLLGWKAYFGMAQTPRVWRELDEWLRHRLRAIQLKHWKRLKAICRELKALGASADVANQVAGNSHRWWRKSDGAIKRVLTTAYFDRLGVPRLS